MRLLVGKKRGAYFKSVVAYCEPKGLPALFSGELRGSITAKVHAGGKDVMPYERIFVPGGFTRVIAELPEVKARISHRVKAFKKLGRYLVGKWKR